MKKRNKQTEPSYIHTSALLLTALMLITASCQDNTIYHTYHPVNAHGWERTDTLVYTLPDPMPVSESCTFEIGIRHNDSYHYRDLWLAMDNDTLHLYLADSIGNWKGSGIGNTRLFTDTIRPARSTQDTLREIRIRHIMQDTPLTDIRDIGIRITLPSDPHPF